MTATSVGILESLIEPDFNVLGTTVGAHIDVWGGRPGGVFVGSSFGKGSVNFWEVVGFCFESGELFAPRDSVQVIVRVVSVVGDLGCRDGAGSNRAPLDVGIAVLHSIALANEIDLRRRALWSSHWDVPVEDQIPAESKWSSWHVLLAIQRDF